MDSEVQDELQAMTGATKVPLFGGARTLSKSLTFNKKIYLKFKKIERLLI